MDGLLFEDAMLGPRDGNMLGEDMLLNQEYNQEQQALQKQQKEYARITSYCQDQTIPLNKRKQAWSTFTQGPYYVGDPGCPAFFGDFNVSKWGGIGGCGFNIWDENGNKYWIDVDTIFNLAQDVKEGPDAANKQNILMSINEENRTPDCLFTLFPQGYKITETGPLKLPLPPEPSPAPAPMGGKKRKSRKMRKTKKSRKSRNSRKNRKNRKSRK